MGHTLEELLNKLAWLSQDLLFPSESDEPFSPLVWASNLPELNPDEVQKILGLSPDTPIEEQTVEEFFARVTTIQAWFEEAESQNAHKFQILVNELLSHLSKPKVFKVGKIEVEVYIVGRAFDTWLGLKTRLVQT
jgi:CRISPR/Cas system-associated protein Csx1